eukprot:TRINITY_DN106804_c0_g1_i1.p1 TRINITY_DN106804_c0_g1~~TRINITY_DN106804_c0_g1_i1.p1  ORF type:complete len:205 (+),score=74.44 TRINITY_DN106804_c0_g1_i1:74-688(+)
MALEQPKKAPTAYFLWLSDNRAAIQREIGSMKGPDVSKAAGLKWKDLSATNKVPYEKKAAEEKATYDKAMEEFTNQGGVRVRSTKSKGDKGEKRKKDPNRPKKPAGGAYGCFLAEKRESIVKLLPGGHKITDVTKKAGEMWKALEGTEKKRFETAYQEKVKAYKAAMEEYRKNSGIDDDEDVEDEEEEAEEAKAPAKRSRKAGA